MSCSRLCGASAAVLHFARRVPAGTVHVQWLRRFLTRKQQRARRLRLARTAVPHCRYRRTAVWTTGMPARMRRPRPAVLHCSHGAAAADAWPRHWACAARGLQYPLLIVSAQPRGRSVVQLRMRLAPAAAPSLGRRAAAARAGRCALQARPTACRGTGAVDSPPKSTRNRQQIYTSYRAARSAAVARTTLRRGRWRAGRLPSSHVRENYSSRRALRNTAWPPSSRVPEDYSSRHPAGANMAARRPRASGVRTARLPSPLPGPAGTPSPARGTRAPRRVPGAAPGSPAPLQAGPAARLRLQSDPAAGSHTARASRGPAATARCL